MPLCMLNKLKYELNMQFIHIADVKSLRQIFEYVETFDANKLHVLRQ